MDTMNFWIESTRGLLLETIAGVDCLVINDEEVKQLTDEPNLVRAARAVHEMGPRVVIAKQGEHGAGMYTPDGFFALPAYPTADVIDPTGAGDTFAGGFMGYVAAHSGEELTDELLRRAMAYGTALASFNVEAFGTERMQTLTGDEVAERVAELQRVTRFDAAPVPLRA
jgi:sugar/nucleoside kinase (ribokinase family)